MAPSAARGGACGRERYPEGDEGVVGLPPDHVPMRHATLAFFIPTLDKLLLEEWTASVAPGMFSTSF